MLSLLHIADSASALDVEHRFIESAPLPSVLLPILGLGNACLAQNQPSEAVSWYEKAYSSQSSSAGGVHPDAVASLCKMATAYLAMGQHSVALQAFESVRSPPFGFPCTLSLILVVFSFCLVFFLDRACR